MPDWSITLLAVVIGGLLTYLVQSRLEERKGERERERDEAAAKREREREEAEADAELRVAKRLVLEELDTIALHFGLIVTKGRVPPMETTAGAGFIVPTDAW